MENTVTKLENAAQRGLALRLSVKEVAFLYEALEDAGAVDKARTRWAIAALDREGAATAAAALQRRRRRRAEAEAALDA